MLKLIKESLPLEFRNFEIFKITGGASKRKYYRLKKNKQKAILMDSSNDPDQFHNFLNVHEIISQSNISIPKIYNVDLENKYIIVEDLGNLLFNKILNKFKIKNLLNFAVESLIIIKNEINFKSEYHLPKYNYNIFKSEISEFVDFFYPYFEKKNMQTELKEEFYFIWKSQFELQDQNFTSFVHKDYNLNNLIYLPNRKGHYRCGIIDFQDSFWGEDCWDLFSLLEDSRVLFSNEHNDYFINYYCLKTNQINLLDMFINKYHFYNCSRQVRLLGRWVKLSKIYKQKYYLNFIDVTNQRLIKSLKQPNMQKIQNIFRKIIPKIYAN